MTDTPDLTVTLTIPEPRVVDPNDLRVQVELVNRSPAPLQLCTLPFPFAVVVLRFESERGVFVGGGPPPIPPPYRGLQSCVVLAPGEVFAREYHGDQYFVNQVPPGRYRVRFRYQHLYGDTGDWTGELVTPWAPFEVLAP